MDIVVRVTVVYAVLLFVFRVLGKRELGSLTPFELVTLMIIPELVSESLDDGVQSLTNALVGVLTLALLVFATSLAKHRFEKVGRVLDNQPTLLVANGRLLTSELDHERVSPDEIYAEMHQVGLERLEQVRWAVLESDGKISIVPLEPGARHAAPPSAPNTLT